MPGRQCVCCGWKEGAEGPNPVWRCFGQTSLSGLPQFADPARSSGVRWLWILVAIVGLALSIVGSIDAVQTYLAYGTVTSVTIEERAILKFPSVTICNLNLYSKQKVEAHPEYHHLLNLTFADALLVPLALINATERAKIAPDSPVVVAVYDGLTIPESGAPNWIEDDYGPFYGRCFTFNPEGAHLSAGIGGLQDGLVVYLDTLSSDSIPFLESTGFLVSVHSSTERANVAAQGILVSPGQYTRIAIQEQRQTSPSEPFKRCAKQVPTRFASTAAYVDEVRACRKRCITRGLVDACGCIMPALFEFEEDKFQNNSFCFLNAQRNCVNSTGFAFSSLSTAEFEAVCDCPPALCDTISFEATASTTNWPTQQTADALAGPYNVSADRISTEGCKLQVFYRELNFLQLEQTPETTLGQTISDVGGVVGLFLGATVLTLFEIVEVLLLFIPVAWRKRLFLHRTAFEDKPDLSGLNAGESNGSMPKGSISLMPLTTPMSHSSVSAAPPSSAAVFQDLYKPMGASDA